MHFYQYEEQNPSLCEEIHNILVENKINVIPYSADIINGEKLDLSKYKKGITISLPGFYGPQGRQLNAKIKSPNYVNDLSNLNFKGEKVVNFEMETSAIYALGSVLGHNAISFSVVIANRATNTFSLNPKKATQNLIKEVLGLITS